MSKFDTFSENNPDMDTIRRRGWAFIQTNGHGKYGAPYTSHDRAEDVENRDHPFPQEVRVITVDGSDAER